MALAKKCDICKRFYEPYNSSIKNALRPNGFSYLTITIDQLYKVHKINDCCPECMAQIEVFVDELAKAPQEEGKNEDATERL